MQAHIIRMPTGHHHEPHKARSWRGEPAKHHPLNTGGANAPAPGVPPKGGFHRRAQSLPSNASEILRGSKPLFWFLTSKRPMIQNLASSTNPSCTSTTPSCPATKQPASLPQGGGVLNDLQLPELSPVRTATTTVYDEDDDDWTAYSTDCDDDDDDDNCLLEESANSEHELIGLNFLVEEPPVAQQ